MLKCIQCNRDQTSNHQFPCFPEDQRCRWMYSDPFAGWSMHWTDDGSISAVGNACWLFKFKCDQADSPGFIDVNVRFYQQVDSSSPVLFTCKSGCNAVSLMVLSNLSGCGCPFPSSYQIFNRWKVLSSINDECYGDQPEAALRMKYAFSSGICWKGSVSKFCLCFYCRFIHFL
jgi:hypothetical protein